MKDHIINENYKYELIGLHGFNYKLFGVEEGGGIREVLYWYPYLKHLIQLWSVYCVNHMAKLMKWLV